MAAGIDSLYCGYHVVPLAASEPFLASLDALRQRAQERHDPVPWEDPLLPGLVYPGAGAKSATYRFHLQTPIANVYIRAVPVLDGTPSVFAAFTSEALWCKGGPLVIAETMRHWLRGHGLVTRSIQPSRCDLAIDVHIPGGIDRSWIEAHLVTRAKQRQAIVDWQRFKGYAVGSRSSPIYGRIYDKSLEIAESSQKFFFWDVWGESLHSDVLRFEFQVNRDCLRELQPPIDRLAELIERLADLWQYLTSDWLSLREPTGERASRRAVLPAWQQMIDAGLRAFAVAGKRAPLVRRHATVGDRRHQVRQGRSWLTSVAAHGATLDPVAAVRQGFADLAAAFDADDFADRVRRKRIRSGRPLDGVERLRSADVAQLLPQSQEPGLKPREPQPQEAQEPQPGEPQQPQPMSEESQSHPGQSEAQP